MLISAHIHKFRSCEDVEIKDFGDITAFIGRNGAGKTNILKAIEWAASVFTEKNSVYSSELAEDGCAVSLFVNLNGDVYQYKVVFKYSLQNSQFTEILSREYFSKESEVLFANNNGLVFIGNHNSVVEVNNLMPSAYFILSLFPKNPISSVLKEVYDFMKKVRYYSMDVFNDREVDYWSNIIMKEEYDRWVVGGGGLKYVSKYVLFSILDLYLKKNDIFEEIKSLICSNGLSLLDDLVVDYIESSARSNFYSIKFIPANSQEGQGYSFHQLSFGTRRIIYLIISMLYDKASVALIEQPEDGIHPGLLQKIIQLLRDYANPNQFILTSHSPYVLNRLKPEEIRMVDMKEGKTRIRVLNEKEIEIANDFIENEGALSEFIDSIEEL